MRSPSNLCLLIVLALSSSICFASNHMEVELRTNDGETFRGELLTVSQAVIELRAGQQRSVKMEEVQSLRFPADESHVGKSPNMSLFLRDGGMLRCETFSSDGQTLTVTVQDHSLAIRAQFVESIVLGELTTEQQETWDGYRKSDTSSDLLAVRQPSGGLAKIEGIVTSIQDGSVQFEFSGQTIPVPFSRLAGIRFFSNRELPPAIELGNATDHLGSNLKFASLQKAGDAAAIDFTLSCGAEITIPISSLQEIRFLGSGAIYLADMPTLRQTSQQPFEFDVLSNPKSRTSLIRRLPSSEQSGPSFEFVGCGEAVFELPPGFQSLEGSLQLRPSEGRFSSCQVQIFSENSLLWEANLEVPRKTHSFKVPLVDGERLRLVVSSSSEIPTGITIHWIQPMLKK